MIWSSRQSAKLRGRGGGAILLLTLAAPSRALAQETTTDTAATARALFDEARALMAAEDYAQACPKFEESERLAPGGGTLLNLALCHEKVGKTASAWVEFEDGLRIARRDARADREELALAHIDALRPRLSRLRVIVPAEARVPGLVVKRNGVALGQAAWGEGVPVDPGEQVIEAEARSKLPERLSATLAGDGALVEIRLAALQDAPASSSAAPAHGAPARDRRSPSNERTTRLWIAGVTAGVGAVAWGVAGYLAMDAHSLNSKPCSSDSCDAALSANHIAVRETRWATAATLGGALLVGAGTYLYFTSLKGQVALTVGKEIAGARLDVQF